LVELYESGQLSPAVRGRLAGRYWEIKTGRTQGAVAKAGRDVQEVRDGAAFAIETGAMVVVPAIAGRALSAARYVSGGFAEGQLDIHFAKHAAEWGAGNITKTSYLKRAQELLGRDIGGEILSHVLANGDVLRYNTRTNEFAVGAADGTIRTLFRPIEGMTYWLQQVKP
jgi:pyocin large subunit-like protein